MIATVLSIAGLDPSGGAGVNADIKTITMLEAYGMSVVTAVTVQHPGEVRRIAPVAPDVVKEQIETLIQHMPIQAIKIGMLCNAEIARAVIEVLRGVTLPIILDPIHQSTTGSTLNALDRDIWNSLFDTATVITPNERETNSLLDGTNPQQWSTQTNTALLCTGVREDRDAITDLLWMPNGTTHTWRHARIETDHTHGTGCTLSSAIATFMARGQTIEHAIDAAIRWTGRLIEGSARGGIVKENGPLLHFKTSG